jgi:predicted GNAT superfamily acetyltransferase
MSKESIEIRPVTDVGDARKLEDIQRRTWNMSNLETLPGRFLHAMHFNGACLLGAYDGSELVGFVFGLLGTVESLTDRIDQIAAARLQMYSAIMGVLPEYQSEGIGYRLKIAQREFAMRIGVRLITWTFDPLEGRNGYLNIRKLGAICHQYERDFHGQVGGINAGLPTDRFYLNWWVTSNRVEVRLSSRRPPLTLDNYLSGGAVMVNRVEQDARGLIVPPTDFEKVNVRFALVEIPDSIQTIKQKDMGLAIAWRDSTRSLFEHYFDADYVVTDFVRFDDSEGRHHSYYVLTRGGI